MTVHRRFVLGAGLSALLTAKTSFASATTKSARLASNDIVALARRKSVKYAGQLAHRDYAAIVDYGAPSWEPRFHLVDVLKGTVRSYLVAHGRGSDPKHSGWLGEFSNVVGSNASSRGAYLTAEHYVGKYGKAMRLVGLEEHNSNAYSRAIVLHPAWYAAPSMISKHGKLGRSEGCFALPEDDVAEVLAKLGPGRLIYSDKLSL